MRIAQLAPLIERIPPKKYGGTERVVHALTEELVKRGHEVTLFASGDSETSATLKSAYPISLREAAIKDVYGSNIWSLLNVGSAFAMQDDFDIIHDHVGSLTLPTAHIARTPVVTTMHGPFTRTMRTLYRAMHNVHVVSISNAQRNPAPELNYAATVYNGLPMDHYPFSDTHDGYLLFVGRISMEKGVHLAVRAAQDLNMRLIIAAKLDKPDHAYFKEYVEPYLTKRIQWIGEVNEEERNELYRKAYAFLHPITWPEPFGLVLIEAMACGCPVIAMGKGSIPEIVQDGKTGFVVHEYEEMLDAIGQIDKIDRAHCRDYARTAFSASTMASAYEKVYAQLVQKK